VAKQKNRVISFFNQSQAETCKITQFPPEIISTKLSKLLRYNIIQTLVVLGNVVDVAIVAVGFEVTTGTLNLTFLGAENPEGHCLWIPPQNIRA